ncbi:MAG: S41 family peptidase [Bacteroidales bacterium]
MLQSKNSPFILIVLFISVIFITGCEEEIVMPDDSQRYDQANEPFYNLMKEWYLWNDELPDINPKDYKTPMEVLDAIKNEKDRWSYITTVEKFEQFYEAGAYIGYGYGQKWDTEDNLRISFVFEDSPLNKADITRGWIIREINGTTIDPSVDLNKISGPQETGVENDFLFESPAGDTIDTTFAKNEIKINSILHKETIQHNGNKTGYVVIKEFIQKTSDELYDVFNEFANNNIQNIIIDLRYNGGGMLSKAKETADYIIQDKYIGEVFAKILHNENKSNENYEHTFSQDTLSLDFGFNKIYFITTRQTASASEALINGMKPYQEVYTIGDHTYGKPVGMYAFYENNERYAFVPVCFRITNAEGEADYYDGLGVDIETADYLPAEFGDSEENSLQQALYHIENGTFSTKKTVRRSPYNIVKYESLNDYIGAW